MSEVIHASQGYVEKTARTIAAEEVAKVVANAPADLDTLKEIAAYIESDKTGAAQMVAQIDANAKAIAKKVNKEEGKDLSTNDYTTAEKEKLGGIEEGAQKNPDLSGYAKKEEVKEELSEKQDALTTEQLDAVNSGITKEKVTKFDGYEQKFMQRYPFKNAAIADGVVTVAPYTNAKLESDGTAFTVAVGESAGKTRDCSLVVDCREIETAPTISWGAEFHPRTDAETDFSCVAGVRNVYWITEYAPNEFTVAGWQETTGGNAA